MSASPDRASAVHAARYKGAARGSPHATGQFAACRRLLAPRRSPHAPRTPDDGALAARALRRWQATRASSRVGYAPTNSDFLLRRLAGSFSPELLLEAGLAVRGESIRDRFRGRITFPVQDLSGQHSKLRCITNKIKTWITQFQQDAGVFVKCALQP